MRNLDAWVYWFLKRKRYDFQIVFGRDKDAWKHALDFRSADLDLPDGFYEVEWEQVVQANGLTTESEYKKVSRVGRGIPLNRAGRIKAWKVFEEYRLQLTNRKLKEVDDAYQDAINLIELEQTGLAYSSVVVDEAQDLSAQGFRLIRSFVKPGRNDLFIAGDCHQRIYGRKTILGRCGIDIRGRSRKLRLNYRTTEQTRAWASRLLEGRSIDDLDGGSDDNRGIRSLTRGPEPLVRAFESRERQGAAIVDYLKQLESSGDETKNVCVVARTTYERNAVAEAITAAGIAAVVIDKQGDDREADGVRVATMHRVKGLEFERMIIASANASLVPLRHSLEAACDESERAAIETMERALVYVSASRAKKELLVLSYGKPSPFLSITS